MHTRTFVSHFEDTREAETAPPSAETDEIDAPKGLYQLSASPVLTPNSHLMLTSMLMAGSKY